MVDIDSRALQARGLAPLDVVQTPSTRRTSFCRAAPQKIGALEYNVNLNGSTPTVEALNDLPVSTSGGKVIYVRDVGHVRDGYAPQTNIVRTNGNRSALLQIEKSGNASTLAHHCASQGDAAAYRGGGGRRRSGIQPVVRSVGVRQQRRQRRGARGADRRCLDRPDDSLLCSSGELAATTLIIAVTIPLSILTSLIALSALGQSINIMTLGGLALAVGILVDDGTVAIENISHHLEAGKPKSARRLWRASAEIAVPTLVSTLSICIVFIPMFLLSGGGALSVRARWGRPWSCYAGLVLLLTHLDSDAGDVFAAQRRAGLCRRR